MCGFLLADICLGQRGTNPETRQPQFTASPYSNPPARAHKLHRRPSRMCDNFTSANQCATTPIGHSISPRPFTATDSATPEIPVSIKSAFFHSAFSAGRVHTFRVQSEISLRLVTRPPPRSNWSMARPIFHPGNFFPPHQYPGIPRFRDIPPGKLFHFSSIPRTNSLSHHFRNSFQLPNVTQILNILYRSPL